MLIAILSWSSIKWKVSNHLKKSLHKFIALGKSTALMVFFCANQKEAFVYSQPTLHFTTMKLQTPDVGPLSAACYTKPLPWNTKVSADDKPSKDKPQSVAEEWLCKHTAPGTRNKRESNECL